LAKPISSLSLYNRIVQIIEKPRVFIKTKLYMGPCRRRRQIEFRGVDRRAPVDAECV